MTSYLRRKRGNLRAKLEATNDRKEREEIIKEIDKISKLIKRTGGAL